MTKPRTYPPRVLTTKHRLSIVWNWADELKAAEKTVTRFRERGPAPMSSATEADLLAIVEDRRERLSRAEAEHGTLAELVALVERDENQSATEG